MKKILGLLAIAAMMVGMLAGPASAAAVGVFGPGTAEIGTDSAEPCNEDSVTGTGLYLPAPAGSAPVADEYWLNTGYQSSEGAGTLNVCGDLGPSNGIGAACGMSAGSNGSGNAGAYSLSNVGWPLTVGGTLPVTGDVDNGAAALVAVVQAQGGAGCIAANGAQTFTVVGAFAIA